ncbi:cytochrome P450 family protein [Lentzea flaviverrucosa]|uniref:Cytochrome P450 n=1 Tax=Lentzea flaviverrucosa TaxID=200379 RepID=A0A1H9UMZ3_9PSEU|nr:cytochrome P450 [Lentzea flaviverrucosa]RDI27831.1 cytochrome P450 [Lentzea flaviverrucosa]SES10574.1 Cytochrome P450 [Lentzea flaviverrucosa]
MTTLTRLPADYVQNPHEVHDLLRAEGPVREVILPHGLKAWLVTRYDEAKIALTDPRVSKNVQTGGHLMAKHSTQTHVRREIEPTLSVHMLNMDPPDHTRLRKLVTKAFTARRIELMRPRVQEIAAELIAKLNDGDEVDLLEAFAFPLPITVICELLGIPIDNRDDFREWSNQLLTFGTPEQVKAAAGAMAGFLFQHVTAIAEAEPNDTFFSALVHADDSGDRLSTEELISMAFLLLVAGHETTVNLIGNAVLSLLKNPEQLQILKDRPELIPASTEEFLRLEGPVNVATFRYTLEPVELGGVTVPADEILMVSLIAANRDPQRYENAGQLDVTRSAQGHVAFGHGIHFCLGAPLARLEFDVALTQLLARFPNLALAAEPETLGWRDSTLIRGLHTLPVRLA